jgi:superfamily II DNA or RNA helicase
MSNSNVKQFILWSKYIMDPANEYMKYLKDYQKLPVEFMKKHFGLILFHSTGTGKTRAAMVALYQFNKHIIIIGPKSSRKAFEDEIQNLGMDRSNFTIYTYSKIKKEMYKDMEMLKDKCVIVDEAHNLRTETRDNMFLSGIFTFAYKVMLLTATPVVNYINDISPLINIVKQEDALPTDRHLFNFFYFDEDHMRLLNQDLLRNKLSNAISYYEKEDKDNYPEWGIIEKKVVMSKDQVKEYEKYVRKLIFYDQVPPEGAALFEFDFDKIRRKDKNAFLTATRQISNTVGDDESSPKIVAIVNIVKQGPFPAVVYSNFLDAGIYPIAKRLEQNNVSYRMITGNTSHDKIVKIVNDYNAGKFDVLLLSSAGSESLDLKNTRQIHIVENHWNEPKIDQVIGRAIRYKSHIDLPPMERNVTIYRWISIFDKNKIHNESADEYLNDISIKKQKLFNTFKDLIIEASIETDKPNKQVNTHMARMYKTAYHKYAQKYIDMCQKMNVDIIDCNKFYFPHDLHPIQHNELNPI